MVKTKNIHKKLVLKKHKKNKTHKNENKTNNNKNIIRINIGHHTHRKNNKINETKKPIQKQIQTFHQYAPIPYTTMNIPQQTLPSQIPLNLPIHTNPQTTQQQFITTPPSKMSYLQTPQLHAFSKPEFQKQETFKMKENPPELKEYAQSYSYENRA